MAALIAQILAAADDPQIFLPAGIGLTAAIAAVLATARYIKRTEDDTVDNLREQAAHLEERCAKCETETRELRAETRVLHRQVGVLLRVVNDAGLQIPDGYPADWYQEP